MPRKGTGATLEALIADLQRVERERGAMTATIYRAYGGYSMALVQLRLGSFSQACAAAGITPQRLVQYASEDLLADLRRVHAEQGYLSQLVYSEHGRYSSETVRHRFGSWGNACLAAGLDLRLTTSRQVVQRVERRCLGNGPAHTFLAVRDDVTHRICDACKSRTAPDPWDRLAVADGWEVVGA